MPIRPESVTQGSFTGMRDSLDPQTADPRKAYLLQNVYPQDEKFGGGTVGRPGFRVTHVTALGSAGKRTTQGMYQYTKLDGTEITIGICGGQFYTYNWTTRVWTESLTVANLASASITLSETARCYFLTFGNEVLVSDGANTPWTWDGTANGGLTKLTNAPVFYGQPVVHYAKVFAIKNTERSAIVWSEEAAANTGYEAGGYNNAWTLGQTDQEALFALYATNEVLYYFRGRSTGAISGQVTTNFATTGTREGVSETVGTESPAAVTGHSGDVYFVDADGRPRMIRTGLGLVEDFWDDARQTIEHYPRAQIADWLAVDYTPAKLILYGVTELGDTDPAQTLVVSYATGTPVFAGIWQGYTFLTLDMVKDGNLAPTLMHGSTDGYYYDHGNPEGTLWDDALQSGTVAIDHAIEGSVIGYDTDTDKHFDRLDLSLRAKSDMNSMAVRLTTPNGTEDSSAFALTGGFSLWDVAVWDTDSWSVAGIEKHHALGFASYGRWARPRITHSAVGEQFGLNAWKLTYYPDAADEAAA